MLKSSRKGGYNETGTNTLYIGNSSSNTLIYGNFGSTTVGIGTTTPSTALVVIGTVTATQGFVGNGSQLTGISASPGADSVSSSTITDGSITGSDLASTLSMSTKSLDIGSITVNAGSFRVDSAGSMTASTITATGSVTASAITTTGTLTASGNLNIASGTLFVDAANNRVGIGTTTPSTTLHVVGTVTAKAYEGGGGYTHYVGELYGGGVVFYVYKTAGVEHGLICSTANLSTSQVWSDYPSTLIGTSAQSNWDGLSNSNAIANYGTSTVSAAKLCLDYTYTDTGTGVYSDWYLPSKRELSLMYSQAFIIEKVLSPSGVFENDTYWSSTEHVNILAWYLNFYGGSQSNTDKSNTYCVRAVRAF